MSLKRFRNILLMEWKW